MFLTKKESYLIWRIQPSLHIQPKIPKLLLIVGVHMFETENLVYAPSLFLNRELQLAKNKLQNELR